MLLRIIYTNQSYPYQNSNCFFCRKKVSKIHKNGRPQGVEAILIKNKFGALILLNFKLITKAIAIKTVQNQH